MTCRIYWLILMGLVCVSCAVTQPVDKMCTEVTANKSYSCEDLGLREIPERLPATTEILDFSFNLLFSLHSSTFSKLKNLVYLDLTRCQINWVYEGAFQSNAHLNMIVLTGNLLMFLADTAFVGPHSLKHLVLTQTGLTSLAFIPMQNLDNLETFDLGSNHISSLQFPPSFPTRNLKYLDFQRNNIQRIAAKDIDILLQMKNLTLILRGNDITHIEAGAFQSNFFYSLDFGGCTDISVVLAGMQDTKIHTLWLGTFEDVNDGLPITPTMLQNLCNISVEHISLQRRHFLYLTAATFQCLSNLQRLDLTHSYISMLPPDIRGMNMLEELILNRNAFKHICNISSAAFPSLTHLYIRGNAESLDLGSGCLETLSKLQHLDLSHSHIANVDCCSKQLKGLSGLQHLNLSYNKLLQLQDLSFKECANLEHLDLAFTRLHINASQGPFRNLHLLHVLNLSYSYIDTNIQYLLQGLQNLFLLNLQGNSFQSGMILNENLFHQVPSLEELILSFCDLTAIQNQAFHALKKLRHVDLSHNKLITFSTDAFSNLKSIYLNFANNKIHVIPRDLLTNLSGQSIINLSYNPLECTCSNIGLLTWYKRNMDKIEDPDGTVCCEPKALAGAKLSTVTLSCGIGAAGIVCIVLVMLLLAALILVLITRFLKGNYQPV
ncbi:CD180 antigen [Emydura macquarii macquarii]|uniref:CD180 antigen n=1 Tax=Emydura macquarii macquarii TaxID=1129001 RepID=UPI00352ABC6C